MKHIGVSIQLGLLPQSPKLKGAAEPETAKQPERALLAVQQVFEICINTCLRHNQQTSIRAMLSDSARLLEARMRIAIAPCVLYITILRYAMLFEFNRLANVGHILGRLEAIELRSKCKCD